MGETDRTNDLYSRADYRKMVAWDKRITREAPFLERLLGEAPDRSVVDLGCGTGEHVAFFAKGGARAVGIDSSEAMIESARDHEQRGHGRFFHADVRAAPRILGSEPGLGLAICLGNVLPHVKEQDELEAFLGAARDVLLPNGLLLVQILNYARILDAGQRNLPLSFREGEGDKEVVFLRLMSPQADGRVLFFPTTLELDPSAEEPVRVVRSKRVPLRAWRAEDFEATLGRLGFAVELCGDMQGGTFHQDSSPDLVVVARRS